MGHHASDLGSFFLSSPNYRINIENSYFKGDISGIDNTGFVAGVDSSYNLLIKNSYVHGDIDGFKFETVIDQKQSSNPISSGLTWIAQTFTPALTGKLKKLDLYLRNYSPGNDNVAYINIYDGSYLSQSSLPASISSGEEVFQQQSPKWYSIDFDVDLSAGHIYTFDISAAGSVQVGWIYGNNNSYSRGSSSLSLDFDIAFRTYMEVESISTPFITGDATSDISLVNSYYYGTADASAVIFDQSASLVDVYSTEVWDNSNADLSLNSATVYTDNNTKTWFAQKYVNTPYKLFWEDNTGVLNVDQSYVDMMTEPHISSVNVYVTEDIIIDASYKYFILDVSGSQENDVIVFDGNNFNIDISVSNIWSGLVHANEPNNENTDIFVSDVSMNVSSGELDNSAGWICSKNFGKAYNSTNIYNCKTNGIITGIGSGGIVGSNMGENTTGNNRLSYCYTTGDISGVNSGGITGANAGKNSKSLTIDKCYTIGNVLGSRGGGLLGNFGGIDCSNLLIENCYTIGYLDAPFGGCGIGFNLGQGQGSYCAIENFYSRGDLSGNDSFGVTGINNNFSYPINKPRMYINNCYIGGNISGDKSCGLFNLEYNVGDLSINNIYLYGIIDQSYTPLYNTYSLLRSGTGITNSPTIDISNVIVSTYNSLDISAYLYSDLISDNSLNITDISYVTTPGTWSNSKANKALENVYKFSNSTPPLTSDVWIESNTNNAPYDLIWQGYNHTEEIDFSLVVLLMDASYSITNTSLIPFNSTKYQSAGSRKIDLPNGLYEYELSYNNITDLSSGLTFNNYAYPDNLIKILSFGNIPLEGISGYQFADLSFSLPDNSNSVPTILQNTSLKGAFYNSRVIDTAKNINNWDVTNVTDMSGTFLKSSFNQVINNWNVRNVTNMESMFMDSSFNKGLFDWSLNSLKNMSNLFKNTNFNRNITKWNTGTVETMTSTFSQTPFDQAIGSWNVSNVTSMNSMFHSDFSFNQDIRYWDVSIDTSLNNMFQGATAMLNEYPNPPFTTMGATPSYEFFNKYRITDANFTKACHAWIDNSVNADISYGPINYWNTSNVTIMNYAFNHSPNNQSFNDAIDRWNTSKVISMISMFSGAKIFDQSINTLDRTVNGIPYTAWNVSNVTSMNSMFNSAESFNNGGSPDISGWNTGKVTDMGAMFLGDFSFNQPIGSWNVLDVSNMYKMFGGDVSFNQNIGSWNVSNVTDMNSMFQGANSFNNGESPDISTWKTGKVKHMGTMFQDATNFDQPIGSWNVSNVENMSGMFRDATSFDQPIGSWKVGNVENMSAMFQDASKFSDYTIASWDYTKVVPQQYESTLENYITNCGMDLFQYSEYILSLSKNYTMTTFSVIGDTGLTRINSPPVNLAYNKLTNSSEGRNITIIDSSTNAFFGELVFDVSTGAWNDNSNNNPSGKYPFISGDYFTVIDISISDTSYNSDMTRVIIDFSADLSNIRHSSQGFTFNNTINNRLATDPSFTIQTWGKVPLANNGFQLKDFNGFINYIGIVDNELYDLPDENYPYIGRITLEGCYKGVSIESNNFGDIEEWKVGSVHDMSGMFRDATNFNENISKWRLHDVSNTSFMFNNATSFNNNLTLWNGIKNIENITSMESMFEGATSYDNSGVELVWSDTSGLLNTKNMFKDSSFNQDISLNTTNVTTMQGMFNNNTEFNRNISSFNTKKVTDMSEMFKDAVKFTNRDTSTGLNEDLWETEGIKSVTTMESMFEGASAFNAGVTQWDVSNVKNMVHMFKNATSFDQPRIAEWDYTGSTLNGGPNGAGTDIAGYINNTGMSKSPYSFSTYIVDLSHNLTMGDETIIGDASAIRISSVLVDAAWESVTNLSSDTPPGRGIIIDGVTDTSNVFGVFVYDISTSVWSDVSNYNSPNIFNIPIINEDVNFTVIDTETFKWIDPSWVHQAGSTTNLPLAKLFNKFESNHTTTGREDLTRIAIDFSYNNKILDSDISDNGLSFKNLNPPYVSEPSITIKSWGGIPLSKSGFQFKGFRGKISNPGIQGDQPALINVSCEGCFENVKISNQDYGNIQLWNTKLCNDMSGMFLKTSDFNNECKNWNTKSVTTMNSMFKNAEGYNQYKLASWDYSGISNNEAGLYLYISNTGMTPTTYSNYITELSKNTTISNKNIGNTGCVRLYNKSVNAAINIIRGTKQITIIDGGGFTERQLNIETSDPNRVILMTNENSGKNFLITDRGKTILDSGGAKGYYGNGENNNILLAKSEIYNNYQYIELNGVVNMESGLDFLKIYETDNTNNGTRKLVFNSGDKNNSNIKLITNKYFYVEYSSNDDGIQGAGFYITANTKTNPIIYKNKKMSGSNQKLSGGMSKTVTMGMQRQAGGDRYRLIDSEKTAVNGVCENNIYCFNSVFPGYNKKK